MKKLSFIFLLFLCSFGSAQNSQVIRDYIETYREIAIEEMLRTGVPASITLAQGIHETSAGQSVLVKKSNNHFGIKCKSDWKGASVSHDDDARGECFRKYDDPYQSYRDHSDFLKYRPHYAFLFKLDPTDYEGWAHGLKKAGYATNPKYPQLLIRLIKDYNLQDYTMIALEREKSGDNIILAKNTETTISNESDATAMAPASMAVSKKDYPSGVFKINQTKVIVIEKGTSYLKLAAENNLSLSRLFEFNDMEPLDIAEYDHLLFLQRKRKVAEKEFHTVEEGQNLKMIAQLNGIRLESIMDYNSLAAETMPAAGSRIYLRGPSPAVSGVVVNKKKSLKEMLDEDEDADNQPVVHTVQQKETLYSISRKYEVSVENIRSWNNLQGSELKPGQQLRIYKN